MTTSLLPEAIAEPWWDEYGRFADHCIQCPTCKAVDDQGVNLGLSCAERDRLHEAFQQARKGGAEHDLRTL
jgi:hypothetical protein